MVTEKLLGVFAWLVNWLLSLFPQWSWPSNWAIPTDSLNHLGLPIGAVLNIPLAMSGISLVLGVAGVTAAIKVVRIVISHVTGGGGMA